MHYSMVPYEKVDKRHFLTMSASGVLMNRGFEQTFTPLAKWESEYHMYCRLMKIKFFFNFRKWKAFYLWRKTITYEKIRSTKKYLNKNLFILNDGLRSALLEVRNMVFQFLGTTFTDVSNIENFELFYFIETQVKSLT